MPTYTYRCAQCGADHERVQSITAYCDRPDVPQCCGGSTERVITSVPGLASSNALAGDRHYDGLRAPDGTDISTRTKHREYMKANNLTLTDDFKGTWNKQLKDRVAARTGEKKDPEIRQTIERELHRRLP